MNKCSLPSTGLPVLAPPSAWRQRGAAALHPLVAAAAVALIILSAVGVGVLTGVLPSPSAKTADPSMAAAEPSGSVGGKDFGKAMPAPEPPPQTAGGQVYAPLPPRVAAEPSAPPPICRSCGTVENVTSYQVQGQGSGVGAVGGGVVGGLLGNQIGRGGGRAAFTVLGAVGGALAGNQVEKHVRTTTQYQMTVRMEDGSVRTFHSSQPFAWRSGEPVRIVNGAVAAR